MAIGIHDVVRRFSPARTPARQRWMKPAAAMLVITVLIRCAYFADVGLGWIRDSDRLRLPGASMLWLPEKLSTTLRVLARNAVVHADVLFSLPGLDSFHLWTDLPAPTPANATHWFTLLSPAQQDAIRDRLATSPRSCLIVHRGLYNFLVT